MPSFYHSRNNPNTGKLLGFSLIVSYKVPCDWSIRYYNERLPGSTYPAGYSQHAQFAVCEIEVYVNFKFGCFKGKPLLFFTV